MAASDISLNILQNFKNSYFPEIANLVTLVTVWKKTRPGASNHLELKYSSLLHVYFWGL